MKRLLLLAFLTISLFANDVEKVFITQGGVITPELQELLLKDEHYKQAILHLTDKKYMGQRKVLQGDPEDKNVKPVEIEVTVPEFNKALNEFTQSVEVYKNQVSAFYGLYLIKSFFGKNTKLEEFRDFSEVLYKKEKNICEAYIDYGETLEKGYYSKVDTTAALKVYKEAFEIAKCKQGWYASVISAKIFNLEK